MKTQGLHSTAYNFNSALPKAEGALKVPAWIKEEGYEGASSMTFAKCTPEKLDKGQVAKCTAEAEPTFKTTVIKPGTNEQYELTYRTDKMDVKIPKGMDLKVKDKDLRPSGTSKFTIEATADGQHVGPKQFMGGTIASPIVLESSGSLVGIKKVAMSK